MTIPIPATNALEEPTVCTRINELWIPVLLGALQAYLNPPQWENGIRGPYMVNPENVWEGDATDNEDAEQQILEIMAALMAGNCEEVMTIPTGTTWQYAGSSAPSGWLLCDGTNYQKADYAALWTLLSAHGATYEVDADTFKVPDMRGRFALGAGSGYSVGEVGGEAEHTLTSAEMPSHTHANSEHAHVIAPHSHTTQPHTHVQDQHRHQIFKDDASSGLGGGLPAGGFSLVADSASFSSYETATNQNATVTVNSGGTSATNPNSVDILPSGGDDPHNNMPPYHALNFIIKT